MIDLIEDAFIHKNISLYFSKGPKFCKFERSRDREMENTDTDWRRAAILIFS